MKTIRKNGFTLVELLVVIAIIGVLVSLLLPAVNSAREAARRSACTNNLRQMVLATVNFESALSALPAGTSSSPSNDVHHTWAAYILPYMEEGNSYDDIDFSVPSWQPIVSTGVAPDWSIRKYAVYNCPSQSAVLHTDTSGNFSHGNYVANSGFVYAVRQITNETRYQIENPAALRGPFEKSFDTDSTGAKLRRIVDGISHTAMYAETKLFEGNDGRGLLFLSSGTFYQHWFQPNSIGDDQNEFCGPDIEQYPCRTNGIATRVGSLTPRSFHPGGVNLGRMDGSTGFINDSIDRRAWAALGTRAQRDLETSALVVPLPPVFQ